MGGVVTVVVPASSGLALHPGTTRRLADRESRRMHMDQETGLSGQTHDLVYSTIPGSEFSFVWSPHKRSLALRQLRADLRTLKRRGSFTC